MSKDPAFLFYYVDFQHGTRKMTFEEKGCYIELLCEQADCGHLSLEDIKRSLGDSFPIWDSLMAKFDKDESGLFFNKILEKRMSERKRFVESRLSNLKKPHKGVHMSRHMEDRNRNGNRDEKGSETKNAQANPACPACEGRGVLKKGGFEFFCHCTEEPKNAV